MSQTEVVQKIKTYILCAMTFFWKWYCLWDNVEKCSRRTGHTWQHNALQKRCALHAG